MGKRYEVAFDVSMMPYSCVEDALSGRVEERRYL
jgi:hypothetical protein